MWFVFLSVVYSFISVYDKINVKQLVLHSFFLHALFQINVIFYKSENQI
jgi:hypothetical protein